MGYVTCDPGTPRKALLTGTYEIGVAGQRYRLRALDGPAYDAHGEKMRG
jgi:hypothetical protein